MMVPTFRLGNITVYPVNRYNGSARRGQSIGFQVDETRYALPGRRIVKRTELHSLANRLGLELEARRDALFMPLDRERR